MSMNSQIKIFKAEYIKNEKTAFLTPHSVYDAYVPLDLPSGRYLAIIVDEDDHRGYPSSWFKIVNENVLT